MEGREAPRTMAFEGRCKKRLNAAVKRMTAVAMQGRNPDYASSQIPSHASEVPGDSVPGESTLCGA
jgi:hypothetical protein